MGSELQDHNDIDMDSKSMSLSSCNKICRHNGLRGKYADIMVWEIIIQISCHHGLKAKYVDIIHGLGHLQLLVDGSWAGFQIVRILVGVETSEEDAEHEDGIHQ